MPFSFRKSIAAALLVCAACSSSPSPRVNVTPSTREVPVNSEEDVREFTRAADVQRVRDAAWLIATARAVEAARPQGKSRSVSNSTRTPAAASTPVSGRRCPAGPIKDEIDSVFGPAAEWAESVVMRESGCQPGARNGSSGSAGLFQLLGHQDLLRAACPDKDPNVSWADPDCNIRAAKFLYDAAGISPWRL